MRRIFTLWLILLTISFGKVQAAEVTVAGISGITFDDAVPSVTLTSDFTIHGLTVTPDGLTLTYASDVFKLFGSAIVKLGTDEITVSFGDETNPGLQVTSGAFDQVSMGVTGNFDLKSLTFAPSTLSFEWDNSNSVFEIYGAASVSFDSENMDIGLGDADSPGIVITNGSLTQINLEVNANISLKNLGFSPENLTFQWDSTTDNFEIFGAAVVSFDSELMNVSLGDADSPGIEINAGTVEKVNLSVSADFTLKSLSFSPDELTFQWDSTTDNFEMFGGANVSFDSETMTVGLGDADSPGIEINAGTVEKVNLSVSADFTLKSLSFSPDALTFQWDSTTDNFEMFGGADVSFDSETMTIGLGDADSPGIEINAGTVEKVNLSLTADFNLKSLSFSPDALTFQWDSTTDNFEIFGGANVSFDSETMTIGLGDADSPGIEINSGTVEKVNLSVTADFNLKSLSFSPDALTFQWDSTTDNFEMYGEVDVSFDSETIQVFLGNPIEPGIEINAGTITKINFGVTADFTMKGLTFSPQGLSFLWNRSQNLFEMYGGADLSFDGQSLSVSLGTSGNPGIKIASGKVEQIHTGITADFSMKGMSFTTDGLTFWWDRGSGHFEMFGSAATTFEGESISVSMGNASDPGLIVNNGRVTHINLGVTADFTLKTMEFEADGLTYHWDSQHDQYEIYGSTSAKFDGESIAISLGNNSDPGIVVRNNVIQHINMGLSGDFNLKAMSFKPDNLTFQYDRNQNHFEMYGSADLVVEGHDAGISMGTNANPGLVFKNGVLQQINVAITENFTLKGLTIKTDNLGVEWSKGTNHFNFYGDIELDIANESINADMGTSSDPGMQFRNGNLHSMDVTVNSDFKIGNLEVTTRDVEVKYISSKFYMTGEIEVDEVWSVIVDLGEGGSNGLEIDASHHPDKLKLTDFKIEVDHVDLGAIDFKKVEISFRNDVIHDAELDVSIPPGYEVDAKMTFAGSPAKLNSIDISFDANSFSSAIPVGDTGIELVHMEGGMFNLADPSKTVVEFVQVGAFRQPIVFNGVYFKGSTAFTFGGPVSLAGNSAALLYNRDDVILSGSGVFLRAGLLIGAYRHSTNNWRSILGDGSISMNLQWGRYYSVGATMNIPSDPLVEFTANAKLASNGTFDALMRVKLKVPHSVPVVGGKTLGSVDGAIRYNKRDINGSYGAGWASYWFFGRHHFGARYRFGPRKVDVIGSGTVSSIQRQVNRELGGVANNTNPFEGSSANLGDLEGENSENTEWVKDVRTFQVPANKSSMFVEVDMGQLVDEAYVSVIGPDGFYDVYEIEKTDLGEDVPPAMEVQDRIVKFAADSAVNLLIMNHEPENDSLQQQFSTLTPGDYDLLISYRASNNVDSVGVRAHHFHPESFGDISATQLANGLVNLDMEYWAAMPDSTVLSVFWNDTASYGGHNIAVLDYGQPDELGFAETELLFNTSQSVHNDSIYFYFVLQDSTNSPVYSDITPGIKHISPASGQVVITNPDSDSILEGIMVFIDQNGNEFYDTEGTSGAFEPHCVTDEEGNFHLNDLVVGETYTIDVVVPFGMSLAAGETGKRTFVYQGIPQTFTFNLKED